MVSTHAPYLDSEPKSEFTISAMLSELESYGLLSGRHDTNKTSLDSSVSSSHITFERLQEMSDSEDVLRAVAVELNLRALISFEHCDIQGALALCRASFEFHSSRGAALRRTATSCAIQSLLNIGRLKAMCGEIDEAVRVFSHTYELVVCGVPCSMGGRAFGEREINDLRRDPANTAAVAQTYIRDSLRAFIRVRDFSSAEQFAEKIYKLPKENDWPIRTAIVEAQLRAALAQGRHARCKDLLRELTALLRNVMHTNPLLHICSVLVARRSGENVQAGRLCLQLREYCFRLTEKGFSPQKCQRFLYLIGLEEAQCGFSASAVESIKAALRFSEITRDEPNTIRLLSLLLEFALDQEWPECEASEIAQRLFLSLSGTCYLVDKGVGLTALARYDAKRGVSSVAISSSIARCMRKLEEAATIDSKTVLSALKNLLGGCPGSSVAVAGAIDPVPDCMYLEAARKLPIWLLQLSSPAC